LVLDDAAKALKQVGLARGSTAPSVDAKKQSASLNKGLFSPNDQSSCPTLPTFKECPNVLVIQGGSGNASGSEKYDLLKNRDFQDRFKDLKLQEKSLSK
jgi:hypothetical protein